MESIDSNQLWKFDRKELFLKVSKLSIVLKTGFGVACENNKIINTFCNNDKKIKFYSFTDRFDFNVESSFYLN